MNDNNDMLQAITVIPPDEPVHLLKGDIMRAMKWRRAIKKYNGEHISAEDWNFLLEMGRLAPSSMGLEAWNMLDITNSELIGKLTEASWGIGDKFPGLDHLVIYTVKNDLHPDSPYFHAIRVSQGYTPEGEAERIARTTEYEGADYQDLTDERKRLDWGAKQVYIVFTQMMVGASLLGIDSTPIEGS